MVKTLPIVIYQKNLRLVKDTKLFLSCKNLKTKVYSRFKMTDFRLLFHANRI